MTFDRKTYQREYQRELRAGKPPSPRARMIEALETIRDLSHGRTGPTLRAIHTHAIEGLGE